MHFCFSKSANQTSFGWASVAGKVANLDPCATEFWILLGPPYLVHVGLILECQVQVLPIHCIELIVRSLMPPARSQVLTRNLFAGTESEGGRDIACDCISPYYQRHIFSRKELRLPAVAAVESGCWYCLFFESGTAHTQLSCCIRVCCSHSRYRSMWPYK
jgi:hypothetical protein